MSITVQRFREAVRKGDVLGATLAVKQMPDVNKPEQHLTNHTPITYLIVHDMEILVNTLISEGADVNRVSCMGLTPLQHACSFERSYAVDCLLQAGADPNIAEKVYGWSALTLATMGGHVDLVETLCSAGAHIDHIDLQGNSMLHHAANASANRYEMVSLLISLGISLDTINAEGQTALDLAEAEGYADVVSILRDAKNK